MGEMVGKEMFVLILLLFEFFDLLLVFFISGHVLLMFSLDCLLSFDFLLIFLRFLF